MAQGFTKDETIIFELGKLQSSVQALVTKLDDYITEEHVRAENHEKRISQLEATKNKQYGAMAALSFVFSVIGAFIGHFIK